MSGKVSGKARGFTFVELLTVMILVGILAAVIVPRLLDNTGVAGPAFRSDVLNALRYAQKTAVSHRRLVCATFSQSSGGNNSRVVLNIAQANPPGAAGCNAALPSPDGAPYVSTHAAVGLGANAVLYFQPSGQISSDAAGTQLASGQVQVSGEAAIQYHGATGYVY